MIKHWRAFIVVLLFGYPALSATAENGVTDNTILIGQSIGITGPISGIAKAMTDGANAYIANVNQQGGIHGRKIIMRIRDDKFDPKTALANAEKLIKEDQVFALFQSYGTPHTVGMFPILAANGVPLIAPSPGGGALYKPFNRLVFNVRARFQDEVIKGVDHFTTVGINSVGMLLIDDAFGAEVLETFSQSMAESKLSPHVIVKFDRFKPDFDGATATLTQANPKGLIIIGPAQHAIPFIKAIRGTGNKMQIMILSNNSSETLAKDLGPDGIGVIVSQIMPPPHLISSDLGQEFRNVATASGVTASYAAMEGFVSAKMMVEGLRRAGRNLTHDGFIRGLETMNRVDLGGIVVTYSPTSHAGSGFVELTMINKDGRFIR